MKKPPCFRANVTLVLREQEPIGLYERLAQNQREKRLARLSIGRYVVYGKNVLLGGYIVYYTIPLHS